MQATIPQATVASAGIKSIAIGQIALGPVTIGQLVLNNASLTLSAVQATLKNVAVNVSLHITFDWHIHVGLPDGIPDIDVGDSYDLGTLSFGTTVSGILVPGINNLHFQLPSLTATNVTATPAPLALGLTNVAADKVAVANLQLPVPGFTLAGLGIGSLSGSAVTVPAAHVGQVSVAHVHGDPITIPTLSLTGVDLPSIAIPSLSSGAPFTIPAVLPQNSVGFDAGILRAAIHITPTVSTHIEQLEIAGANATATTGDIVLHNVTLPYDALNLTLSQVGIETVAIPSFTVA